jgi:hypothetical protein
MTIFPVSIHFWIFSGKIIILRFSFPFAFRVLIVRCLHALLGTSHAFDLEMISIIPYNLSLGVALPWTGAALQVAADNVRSQYSATLNLSVTLLYRNKDQTCEDTNANAMLLLTDYYYTQAFNRCVAVIASGQFKWIKTATSKMFLFEPFNWSCNSLHLRRNMLGSGPPKRHC